MRGAQQLFVPFHSPGATWDHALGFMEQPGIEQRAAFIGSLTARGLMVLGGPLAGGDAAGPVGVAVVAPRGAAEAGHLALEDRSLERGLIRVRVRPWTVPMGSALGSLPAAQMG